MSDPCVTVARIFDSLLDPAAHRLAFIAELMARPTHDPDDARHKWTCDNWDSAADEIGCATRTRTQARQHRINAERKLNDTS
ncbi:hypothetical protein [Mycolicibacterium mengxianglii]|uniref:hypothetical protein n=1 Tax=Mycolicibacterium mengxianglii TaxID=2736649 RepID=UPI0018D0809C|nr:hypothetical protein [Mycolicibacterium mengxianglii]